MKRTRIIVLGTLVALCVIAVGLLKFEPEIPLLAHARRLRALPLSSRAGARCPPPDRRNGSANCKAARRSARSRRPRLSLFFACSQHGRYDGIRQGRAHGERFLEAPSRFQSVGRADPCKVAEAKHQFAEALAISHKVLRESPNNDEALSLLVTSNLAVGNLAEAARAAEDLSQRKPSLTTLSYRALVLAAQGRDEEAVFFFSQSASPRGRGRSDAVGVGEDRVRALSTHGGGTTKKPVA